MARADQIDRERNGQQVAARDSGARDHAQSLDGRLEREQLVDRGIRDQEVGRAGVHRAAATAAAGSSSSSTSGEEQRPESESGQRA